MKSTSTPARHTFSGRLKRGTALAAIALIATSGIALAQDAAPAAAPQAEEDIQTVVVTGTRASLASAINRKKRAGTVSDSIVAEDIGQFPDKNVGEALGRVTGVQLARDFGEGSGVSIRGVEPDLNRVEINGMSTLTASNVSVYGGGGRSSDFRELQSDLVKSIDVFKGFTADMTEGGVGGTVSISTRRPLDFRKPTFSITGSLQHLDLMDGWTPRTNFFGALPGLMDGKLGIMANITFDKVKTRGDFSRNTEWVRLADFNGDGVLDYSPRIPRYGLWYRDDNRMSAEFTAQYKFSDNLNGWVSYQTNTRDQVLNDINYGTDLIALNRLNNSTLGCTTQVTAANASQVPGVKVDANNNVTEFVVGNCLNTSGRGGQASFGISSRDFTYTNETNYLSYGFNFVNEKWKIEFLGSNSESDAISETNQASITFNTPGLKVTLDGAGNPIFTFAQGYSPTDKAAIAGFGVQYRPSTAHAEEDQYKLDFDYQADWGPFKSFKFGGRHTQVLNSGYGYGGYLVNAGNLSTTADDIWIQANRVDSTANVIAGQTFDQSAPVYQAIGTGLAYNNTETWSSAFAGRVYDEVMVPTPGSFLDSKSITGIPTGWLYPDFDKLSQYLDVSHFNMDNMEQAVGNDGKTYPQIPYILTEKTNAGYARSNFEFPLFGLEFEGNVGLRYVKTETTATGSLTRREIRSTPTDLNPLATTTYTVSNSQVSFQKEYSDTLPSFNLSAWIIPGELQARAGWAKVMARPKLGDLTPGATCTFDLRTAGQVTDDVCSAGNPSLRPYRANQSDFSVEWYPNRDTQVSIGLFHKDIKSYILARTLVANVDYFGDGKLIDVTMPINGAGAVTKGVEFTAKTAFTFLPGVWSGLGADFNYTYSTAENVGLYSQLDGSELPFPGLSEDSYNVSLWYDKGPLNARLAYSYRSEWMSSAADRSGNPVFRAPTGYLDGKITFKPSNAEGLSLFVEGKNLTGETERTTAGSDYRLSEYAYSGKRFFAGFTIKR